MRKNLKIAIVHDYLHLFGGAEGVTNAIWELFPDADIYSPTYDAAVMKKAKAFQGAHIISPQWGNSLPAKLRHFVHKLLVANLPIYFYFLNLSKYDLVISSTAHFAKGVRTKKPQVHISYIHTPPRFLYGYPGDMQRKRAKWYWKALFFPIDTILRFIDKQFAKHPDFLLCNSEEVRQRILRFYKRDAHIIHPFPNITVSDPDFKKACQTRGEYFLVVSRLSDFKHIDLCIETCGKNNIPLKIAGTGFAEASLKKLAQKYPSVEMLGFVSDPERQQLYMNCIGVLCTVEKEDFGMVPLEPMLYGKPVVAYKDAGYLETVEDGKSGIFFETLSPDSLLAGIQKLKKHTWNPIAIRTHAQTFSKARFQKEFREFVESV